MAIRILSHYRVSDPDVACAALLHDAVEDHAADIAPGGDQQAALAVLAGRFGARTAALVAAVTNPEWEPGREEHEQYREHVLASLEASPWARVIKASDFTDNAVGIIYTTGPKLAKLAGKYGPLVPALRELILRPDTPLEADVKDMIAAQLDAARDRFAAIGPGRDGDTATSPPSGARPALPNGQQLPPPVPTQDRHTPPTAPVSGARRRRGSRRQVPGDRGGGPAYRSEAADVAGQQT